jgi:hypothetical protein
MALKTLKAALCIAAVATAAAGCSDQQASTLDSAFKQGVQSADMSMTVSGKTDGQAFSFSLAGPYQSNGKGKLPSLDWQLQVQAPQIPTIQARVITSKTNAFVVFDGQTYEVGEQLLAQSMKGQGSSQTPSFADLKAAGIDVRSWLEDADANDRANLDGEPVTRYSGRLDVDAALKGLRKLAGTKFLNSEQTQALSQLSDKDIQAADKAIKDPRFEVDVAKSDGKLRRIAAKILPATGSGVIDFEIRYKNVDKPVTIDAPKSGRPITDLAKALQEKFGGGSGTTQS